MSMHTAVPDFYGYALATLVVIWLTLLTLLWMRLIKRHPDTYESMGRPHFLTPIGSLATLRFIFGRRHRSLGDHALGVISDFALVVALFFMVGFVSLALFVRQG